MRLILPLARLLLAHGAYSSLVPHTHQLAMRANEWAASVIPPSSRRARESGSKVLGTHLLCNFELASLSDLANGYCLRVFIASALVPSSNAVDFATG